MAVNLSKKACPSTKINAAIKLSSPLPLESSTHDLGTLAAIYLTLLARKEWTMTRNKTRKSGGFSFIEVLLAMALISFLLAGTAELVIHSISLYKKADDNLRMAGLVLSKLESLKSLPYESVDLQAASYHEVLAGPFPEVYLGEWTIEDVSPNAKRIELIIYPENHPEKTVRISSFISKELGF